MRNYNFTAEEKNEALSFAYSMGLTSPAEKEEISTALDFARAMGLHTNRAERKIEKRSRRNNLVVAQPRFI